MVAQTSISSLGVAVIAVSWMQAFLGSVFIAVRLYTRVFVSYASVGADDILMLISGALVIASAAANTVGTFYGFGKHYNSVSDDQFGMAILFEMVCETTMLVCIVTSKSSVAWFLMRLVAKRWQRIVLWFIIVSLAVMCLTTAIINWVQCTPIPYAWSTRKLGEGHCWVNISNPSIVAGVWSALADFALAGLPWIIVMPLNMRKQEKISIAASLSLGVFAAACGIVRTVELKQLENTHDYTYATVPTLMWALTELNITIICANIPCMRPLYQRLRRRSRMAGQSTEQSGGSTTLESIPPKRDRQRKAASTGWTVVDEDDLTMAEALGGVHHGKYSSQAIGGRTESSETILREAPLNHVIHVKEDINVSVESRSSYDRS